MTIEALLWLVIWGLVAFAVAGIVVWRIKVSPMPEPPRSWAIWGIWTIAAIIVCFWLVRLLGNPRLW
jgi:hypothetical protein